uniref:Protein kinase domain-containing protein n=1 Tax=Salix viminalis TaxID=40686 RepID=A0A6N2NBA2_SALVM
MASVVLMLSTSSLTLQIPSQPAFFMSNSTYQSNISSSLGHNSRVTDQSSLSESECVLTDGKEIAVKRLSRNSWQGLAQFKNEIILTAKLQHRNLVKLLGCGIEGEEKLLIYEFMPEKSLDVFICGLLKVLLIPLSDEKRRAQLDWETCYNIINGNHEMTRIIHRV